MPLRILVDTDVKPAGGLDRVLATSDVDEAESLPRADARRIGVEYGARAIDAGAGETGVAVNVRLHLATAAKGRHEVRAIRSLQCVRSVDLLQEREARPLGQVAEVSALY